MPFRIRRFGWSDFIRSRWKTLGVPVLLMLAADFIYQIGIASFFHRDSFKKQIDSGNAKIFNPSGKQSGMRT